MERRGSSCLCAPGTKSSWLGLLALLAASPARASEAGLEIFPDPQQLLPLVIIFVALIFPVDRLLLRPLLRVLDERAARIEGARRRASDLSQEAEASLARYQETIDSARLDAEGRRRALVESTRAEQGRLAAEARAEAEQEIERARAEIGVAIEEARGTLAQAAEALARDAVERILGRRAA